LFKYERTSVFHIITELCLLTYLYCFIILTIVQSSYKINTVHTALTENYHAWCGVKLMKS
jgi:hypothetical protein